MPHQFNIHEVFEEFFDLEEELPTLDLDTLSAYNKLVLTERVTAKTMKETANSLKKLKEELSEKGQNNSHRS